MASKKASVSGLPGKAGQQLGDELIAKILGLLSTSDLARAEATCIHWRNVTREHSIWLRHYQRLVAAVKADAESRALSDFLVRVLYGQSAHSDEEKVLAIAAAERATASRISRLQRQSGSDDVGEAATGKHQYRDLQASQRWRFGDTRTRYLAAHTGPVSACAAWGGHWLASGSADQTVRLWDLTSGANTATLKHSAPVSALGMLGPSLVVAGSGSAVYLWREGRCMRKFRVEGQRMPILQLTAHDAYLAATSADTPLVLVWDLFSGTLQCMLRPHELAPVSSILAADIGNHQVLISGDSQGRVALTSLDAGIPIAELSMRSFLSMASADLLSLTPDGQRLLVAGKSGEVVSWDLRMMGHQPGFAGQVLQRRPERSRFVALSAAQGGDVFALAREDGCLQLHDMHSGQSVRSVRPGSLFYLRRNAVKGTRDTTSPPGIVGQGLHSQNGSVLDGVRTTQAGSSQTPAALVVEGAQPHQPEAPAGASPAATLGPLPAGLTPALVYDAAKMQLDFPIKPGVPLERFRPRQSTVLCATQIANGWVAGRADHGLIVTTFGQWVPGVPACFTA